MHGIAILVRNSMSKNVLRIPDESDLEVVHIRISNTVPAVNIIGTYLDVDSRKTRDEISNIWSLYTDKVNMVRNRGCLLYTSPSPRDRQKSRMPSSA